MIDHARVLPYNVFVETLERGAFSFPLVVQLRCSTAPFGGLASPPMSRQHWHTGGRFSMPKKLRSIRKPVIVLYGNVSIPKAYCPEFRTEAFIVMGRFACCDASAESFVPSRFIRESIPEARRKLPPMPERRRILALQDVRCFYCGVPFDTDVFRHGVQIRIKINWDHQLPFAYSQDNKTSNFVAACHVCNGLKSSKLFQTVAEATAYLALRRKEKGYDW